MAEKAKMVCLECGAKFNKKLGAGAFEVKCPKCGGYDTDLDEMDFVTKLIAMNPKVGIGL